MCFSVLRCVAVGVPNRRLLRKRVAVVLECVRVCFSVLECVAVGVHSRRHLRVAVCYSVLQCV